MKAFPCIAFVAAVGFAPALSAQENPSPPANAPPHSEGTKPDNRGSTGWNGGTREVEKTETTGSIPSRDDAEAANQPAMASGVDLKGPPVRFPPNKTPE